MQFHPQLRASALFLALALGATGASAATTTIGFDDMHNVLSSQLTATDSTYQSGDAFIDSGFIMTLGNGWGAPADEAGLLGARINGADLFACTGMSCPVGNSGNYFAGLNDASLTLARSDAQPFRLASLRFSLLTPDGGMPDFSAGQLVLTGTGAGGAALRTSMDFGPRNADGNYTFSDWTLGSGFSSAALSSLTISACLYDGAGACVGSHLLTQNQAQFALDDLNVSCVPEPSTGLMLLAGLAGLALYARRRQPR